MKKPNLEFKCLADRLNHIRDRLRQEKIHEAEFLISHLHSICLRNQNVNWSDELSGDLEKQIDVNV